MLFKDFRDEFIKYDGPKSIVRIIRAILKEEKEISRKKPHFWVVGLDEYKVIWFTELLTLGQQDVYKVKGRRVFRFAALKDVPYLIVVQYDPERRIAPTRQEIRFTEKLITAGFATDSRLLDHLILNNRRTFSFQKVAPFPDDEDFWEVSGRKLNTVK